MATKLQNIEIENMLNMVEKTIEVTYTPLEYVENPNLCHNGGAYEDTTIYTRMSGDKWEVSYASTMDDCDPATGEARWHGEPFSDDFEIITTEELKDRLMSLEFPEEPDYGIEAVTVRVDGKYLLPYSYYRSGDQQENITL